MKLNLIRCATLWVFGLAGAWASPNDIVQRNEAALPAEVREHLEKQRTALRLLYIEYEQTVFVNNLESTSTNSVCFQGNRFFIKNGDQDSEVSFDGDVMWTAESRPTHVMLRKTSLTNTARLTELYWKLPYFEAAGIYCPMYPWELGQSSFLEPAALKFVENSDSTEIVQEGANLRVTCYVDDWVLVNIQKTNLETFRKTLENSPTGSESISNQLDILERAQKLIPKRKISMLLDSKHGYALAERADWTADGQLIARFNSEEWEYFEQAGLWLPGRCLVSYFTKPYLLDKFSAEPVRKLVVNLKSAEFAERKIEFTLSKAPKYTVGGTILLDDGFTTTTGNGLKTPVMLTVTADGRLLQKSASLAQGEISTGMRRLWISILLFIVFLPVLLFLLWRSRVKED